MLSSLGLGLTGADSIFDYDLKADLLGAGRRGYLHRRRFFREVDDPLQSQVKRFLGGLRRRLFRNSPEFMLAWIMPTTFPIILALNKLGPAW